jgi:hypothetical protein
MRTQAYLYCGNWVADCPRDGCSNTEPLGAPAAVVVCRYCGQVSDLVWPTTEFMELATAVLSLRPLPHNRNWYPQDHPNATAWGIETGQDIDALRQENLAHGVAAG